MKNAIYLFIITLFMSGCARYSNIAYVQDLYNNTDSTINSISATEGSDLKLRVDDNIYVNIYGLEYNQLESFNKDINTNNNYNELSLYLKGYIIDQNGFIEVPVIGKVKLSGLSLSQAKDTLQKKVNEYLVGATVDIRLISYTITLIGEVKKPGKYNFYKREINLIDALAKAGDLSKFGDARNIILIRKGANKSETYNFNITKTDFYNSPYFWLKPDDVIYVKPLKYKMVSINSPTFSLIFSGLTTLILLLTYVNL